MLIRYEIRQLLRAPFRFFALMCALAILTAMLTVSVGLRLACRDALLQADQEYSTVVREKTISYTDYRGMKDAYTEAFKEQKKNKDLLLLHRRKLETVLLNTDHSLLAATAEGLRPRLLAEDISGDDTYAAEYPNNMVLLVVRCESAEDLIPTNSWRPKNSQTWIHVPRAGYLLAVEEVALAHARVASHMAERVIAQSATRLEDQSLPLEEGGRYLVWGRYEGGTKRFGTLTLIQDISIQLNLPTVRRSEDGRHLLGTYDGADAEMPIIGCMGELSLDEFMRQDCEHLWDRVREVVEVSANTLQVLSSDSVRALEPFLQNRAELVLGRDFSAEEIAEGSRVCVLHEDFALANGLTVGDTVTLRCYVTTFAAATDKNKYISPRTLFTESSAAGATSENGNYTIVGIYRTADQSSLSMALHPNTVLVPQSALSKNYTNAPYDDYTMILPRGGEEAFEAELASYGIGEMFEYEDVGNSQIIPHITAMAGATHSISLLCLGVWALMGTIILLLYTTMQRTHMRVKYRVGVSGGMIWRQTAVSVMILLIPSVLIGTVSGILLYDRALTELMRSGFSSFYTAFGARESSEISVQIFEWLRQSPKALGLLGLGQLAIGTLWMLPISACVVFRDRM